MQGGEFIKEVVGELKLRNYSAKTIKAYSGAIERFLIFANDRGKEPLGCDEELVKEFLLNKKEQGCAPKTQNVYLCALKFFFRKFSQGEIELRIKVAKRGLKVPVVLDKEEILTLLSGILNLKHRLMLSLAYGAGLRVSEVVNLRVADLDFSKNLILVRGGKGNRDRQTILPSALTPLLREFAKEKNLNDWLFAGRNGDRLSTRTLQEIFTKNARALRLNPRASFHSLRHSFATHLLESGTDIRYIQELLGHKKISTTEIYTMVRSDKIRTIVSPID